jgi:PAS domain S-box-containing protein
MKNKTHDEHGHHEALVEGAAAQLRPVLEGSAQPMFIYLDDNHKTCNEKFAHMLGYASAKEWSGLEVNFVETFLAPESRDLVMENYAETFSKKLSASAMKVTWLKKDGTKVATDAVHVPMTREGHLFALLFVTRQD